MSFDEKSLECPFTWLIDGSLINGFEEDKQMITSVKDQPVMALMNGLINLYNVILKSEFDEAKKRIIKVKRLWNSINLNRLMQENISRNAIWHITNSTLYHAYIVTGEDNTAKEILDDLTDSKQLTSGIQLATFHGCRSIFLSSFHHEKQALIHARKAIAYSPDCPLWHLLSYKALSLRGKSPLEERQNERNAIIEYAHSSNEPYYLLHAAKIYHNLNNPQASATMYKRAYMAGAEGTEVLLKLALHFVHVKQWELADEHLAKLEIQCRESQDKTDVILCYTAKYLEALGNYKEAAMYYKSAADFVNYDADIRYIMCARKYDNEFDVVRHLNVMIIKYSGTHYTQQTLLHLAMQYDRRGECEKAFDHFIKAIRIDKQSCQLKKFRNRLIVTPDKKRLNIFHYVKRKFIPKCNDVDCEIVRQLRELCD